MLLTQNDRSITAPRLGTWGFYLLNVSSLTPSIAQRVIAYRILRGRDLGADADPRYDDPEGYRAIDLFVDRERIKNPRACILGSPWREPRRGPIVDKRYAGEEISVRLVHTGKNFFVEEQKPNGAFRIAREFDLARAGVSLKEALSAISLEFPKFDCHSLSAGLLKPLQGLTLTTLAEITPEQKHLFGYVAFVSRNPEKGTDFDIASAEARRSLPNTAEGNQKLLNWFRKQGYGGIFAVNESEVLGHIFYQWHEKEVRVFSVYVPEAKRHRGLGSAITGTFLHTFPRNGECEKVIFGKGVNAGMNAVCHRVGVCSTELGVVAQRELPHVFTFVKRSCVQNRLVSLELPPRAWVPDAKVLAEFVSGIAA